MQSAKNPPESGKSNILSPLLLKRPKINPSPFNPMVQSYGDSQDLIKDALTFIWGFRFEMQE